MGHVQAFDTPPMTSRGSILGIPWAALAGALVLGLGYEWTVAKVFDGLIVQVFGGAAESHAAITPGTVISYVSTALSCAMCSIYCHRRGGPSRVIVVVHLVAVIVPLEGLVAAGYEFASPTFATSVALAYICALALAAWLPEVRLAPAGKLARAIFAVCAGMITLYVYGALLATGGLGRVSFDLYSVYKVRTEFLESAVPLTGYLVPWQGYVLNPSMMLMGLRRRSLLLGLSGLVLQFLLFGVTGYRAFLFLPILLLAFYIVGRRRELTAMALLGALAVIALALALYAMTDEPLVPSMLVDRLLVIPAQIHYWYYNFFGVHHAPLEQLSQSILAPLSSDPFQSPIAEVIGWTYMNSDASANVGLFGDAFANFGYLGCLIFSILLAIVLKGIDAAGRAASPRVAAALVAMPAFELVNSGLLTTLLTEGLALAAVTLWVMSDRPAIFAGRSEKAA